MRCLPICLALIAVAPGCDGEPQDPDPPDAEKTGEDSSDPAGSASEGEADDGELDDGDESGSEGGDEHDSGESGAADDESSGGGEEGCGLSHAADIQPLWEAYCTTNCHEPGGNWMSLMLTETYAYVSLVDRDGTQTSLYEEYKLVIPHDVENSYLIHKLRNLQEQSVGGLGGVAMPAVAVEGGFEAGPPLADEDIELIEDWIDCGAPE